MTAAAAAVPQRTGVVCIVETTGAGAPPRFVTTTIAITITLPTESWPSGSIRVLARIRWTRLDAYVCVCAKPNTFLPPHTRHYSETHLH